VVLFHLVPILQEKKKQVQVGLWKGLWNKILKTWVKRKTFYSGGIHT